MKDPKNPKKLRFERMEILHPHRILSYLFNVVGLDMPVEEVEEYWRHLREEVQMPWAVQSPATSQHVPVGIHGDAARLWTVSKFEKLVGVSMNLPLFRPRTARFSRFLLFVCPSEKLWKNRTLNEVFKRLTWSFNAAFDGKNPSVGCPGYELSKKDKDRAGLPLTHAHRKFTLCELRGDWEWNRDVWRPKAAWNARQVCMFLPSCVTWRSALLVPQLRGKP